MPGNRMTKEEYDNALHDTLDFCINIGNTCFPKSTDVGAIDPKSLTKLTYCGPLLIRAMHKAHAINLLLRENMFDEARIILRAIVEISFIVKALTETDSFIETYMKEGLRQNLRYLKNLREAAKFPETMYKFDGRINEVIDRLEKRCKGTKKVDVVDYAKEAGMLPLYYGPYSILCSSVHSGATDMQSYFRRSRDGTTLIISKPDENDPDLIYFTAIEAMKNIIDYYAKLTSTSHTKIDKLNSMYSQLNGVMHMKYVLKEDPLKDREN